MQKSIDAIIVAGGTGSRLKAEVPKAFVTLGGRPLFTHSLLQFAAHNAVTGIIVVAPADRRSETESIIDSLDIGKKISVAAGGEHRWQSVKNGVDRSKADWVMIHDAARPFVSVEVIDGVIAVSARFSAVISAVPEVDTVRKFSGDRALETLDRNELVRVQTPQMFKKDALLAALERAPSLSPPPTDDAMLLQAAGIPVGIAWGDPLNFKITTKEDLSLAEALCKKHGRF